jgi:hypothetical protein
MSTKKRLGELLIEAGVIDDTMLQSALGHQRRWGGRIGQALLDLKLTTEPVIVATLAKKVGYPVARLDQLDPAGLEAAGRLVGPEFALKHNLLPLAVDNATLTVATADPTNLSLIDELRFRVNRRIKVTIAGDRELAAALKARFPSAANQQVEAISLDSDASGEYLPQLSDPFGGGSAAAFEANLQATPRSKAPELPEQAAARASHLGTVPYAGFTQREMVEGLTPLPLPVRSAPAPAPPPSVAAPAPAAPPRAQPQHAAPQPQVPAPARPAATPAPVAARPVAQPAAAPQPKPVVQPAAAPQPRPAVQSRPTPTGYAGEEEMVEGRLALRPLTPREIVVLDALERLASGAEDVPLPVKPSQVAAALLRIMLRKHVVSQQEQLDELLKK